MRTIGVFLFVVLTLCVRHLPAQDIVEFLREQQEDFVPSPPSAPWWEWNAATGAWGGLRMPLQERGVELFGGYNYVLQSAISGSSSHDVRWLYSGMLDYGIQLDLEKLIGWPGASVQTTWVWIHGNTIEESVQDHCCPK